MRIISARRATSLPSGRTSKRWPHRSCRSVPRQRRQRCGGSMRRGVRWASGAPTSSQTSGCTEGLEPNPPLRLIRWRGAGWSMPAVRDLAGHTTPCRGRRCRSWRTERPNRCRAGARPGRPRPRRPPEANRSVEGPTHTDYRSVDPRRLVAGSDIAPSGATPDRSARWRRSCRPAWRSPCQRSWHKPHDPNARIRLQALTRLRELDDRMFGRVSDGWVVSWTMVPTHRLATGRHGDGPAGA